MNRAERRRTEREAARYQVAAFPLECKCGFRAAIAAWQVPPCPDCGGLDTGIAIQCPECDADLSANVVMVDVRNWRFLKLSPAEDDDADDE